MRILIAEDEVEIARALKVLLEKNKCSVDIVHKWERCLGLYQPGEIRCGCAGYYDAGNGRA